MMKLFLVRHADAPFTDVSDHQRPLSELGQIQARTSAQNIKQHVQDNAAFIVTSDAKRTLQTAAIIEQHLSACKIVSDNVYYHASVGDWCDAVTTHQMHKILILVGHNPTISFLSKYICPIQKQSFSPACVAQFHLEIAEDGLKLPAQFIEFFSPDEQ